MSPVLDTGGVQLVKKGVVLTAVTDGNETSTTVPEPVRLAQARAAALATGDSSDSESDPEELMRLEKARGVAVAAAPAESVSWGATGTVSRCTALAAHAARQSEAGQWSLAVGSYRAALALMPTNSRLVSRLAEAEAAMADTEKAKAAEVVKLEAARKVHMAYHINTKRL
jgi:hypothetical protein